MNNRRCTACVSAGPLTRGLCKRCDERVRRRGFAVGPLPSRRLPEINHGGVYAYRRRGCRCDRCTAAHLAANAENSARSRARHVEIYKSREPRSHGLVGYRSYACRCEICCRAQRERVLPGARHNIEWTSAEMEIALHSDLTAYEAGMALGRTEFAVRTMRRRLRREPKYRRVAGLEPMTTR